VRYGIIGCGRIYRNHAQAARRIDGVELVGVVDFDEPRAQAAAKECGVPAYAHQQDLLAAGVDAAAICLPHDRHADVCVELAQAGVHVLCEKPIATTLEDATRMIEACDAAGVQLGVVFQHRFNENSMLLRRLIDSGALGTIVMGTAVFQYQKSPADAAYFGWRGTYAQAGGGTLGNFGVHTVDLFLWLMGGVAATRGFVDTLLMGTEVEDTGAVALRFESGALGTIAATIASAVSFESRIVVAGSNATATLTDSSRLEVEYVDGRRHTHVFEGDFEDPSFETKPPYGRGHIGVLQDFAAAVRDGRPPASDGRSARETQAVITSVYEQEGRLTGAAT
jgi:UDP-N-acetyl-2-amino-2-deoxyglucuronate dehydrogenase